MTGIPARLEWTRLRGTGPLISVLGPITGRTVIEMGCGTGHNLAHLAARHGSSGVGIDHDPVKIARARRLYGQISGLTFMLGDAATLMAAMSPASADMCVSIFGALSFTAPCPILSSAAHVLRPGGLLAITLRAGDHHDYVTILTRRAVN
jgi:SAM-dependent methyltransferase